MKHSNHRYVLYTSICFSTFENILFFHSSRQFSVLNLLFYSLRVIHCNFIRILVTACHFRNPGLLAIWPVSIMSDRSLFPFIFQLFHSHNIAFEDRCKCINYDCYHRQSQFSVFLSSQTRFKYLSIF